MDTPSVGTQGVEDVPTTLLLKNNLDQLTTLNEWVNKLARKLEISPNDTFRLDLLLAEAVTNVIQYAYPDKGLHQIKVTFQYQKGIIRLEVQDEGQPFDPLQNPEVIFPRSLDEASEGGLGIHLIRSYADECMYKRENEKNILTMIVKEESGTKSQDDG